MSFLSAHERRTLTRICETLIPAEDILSQADTPAHPNRLEEAFERTTDQSQRLTLKVCLNLLENGAFNRFTAGQTGAFSDLPLAARERVLQSWAHSDYSAARSAFQVVKRLAFFLTYSVMPDNQPNPAWETFHYQLPTAPSPLPSPIQPLSIEADQTLTADVLVIGSGAGGGVVAAELAAAGFDVIVAEKGGYHRESDFHGREFDSTLRMFERHGALTNHDLSMLILAGSTLGGGTTINWSASFRPPESLLDEWAREHGFDGATSPEFNQSLDAVLARLNVSTAECDPNPQNCTLQRGCEKLGYHVDVIPRNVKGCGDCGFCNFGCRFGAKQSTLKTYLQDAADSGARILARATVERLTHSNGVVTGAIMQVRGGDGALYRVAARAKLVVMAAGAIGTPTLLLKSGLTNPNIGANLHLHPTTSIYGLFDESIRGWAGAPMTRYSGEFADLDGRGYGARLETAPIHPGMAALSLPWVDGRQHQSVMAQLEHMASIIILTRDRGSGSIRLNRRGQPKIYYRLNSPDAAHLMQGTLAALRVHHAACAYEISSPHTPPLVFRKQESSETNPWRDFDSYLAAVAERGIEPNRFALFSAHQMSSCRIGGSPQRGAINPAGESYEVRNLFVADASALPTASGVNPMITIMATAHYIAQQIKLRQAAS